MGRKLGLVAGFGTDNLSVPKPRGSVLEFQGKMRLSANPFDVVGADIEVTEGSLALIVSDHEIGEWRLDEVGIDLEVDGFHMRVDGEEFVFTTAEADEFARALGISKRPPTPSTKSGRSARSVKTRSTPAPTPARIAKPARAAVRPKLMAPLLGKLNISSPQGKITLAVGCLVVTLAIVARPVLAGLLLFIGMAGVLLIGATTVDPLLATRLPEGWPPSRLVIVALTVIVAGLLLVAF